MVNVEELTRILCLQRKLQIKSSIEIAAAIAGQTTQNFAPLCQVQQFWDYCISHHSLSPLRVNAAVCLIIGEASWFRKDAQFSFCCNNDDVANPTEKYVLREAFPEKASWNTETEVVCLPTYLPIYLPIFITFYKCGEHKQYSFLPLFSPQQQHYEVGWAEGS